MKFVFSQLTYLLKQPLQRDNLARPSRLLLILFGMIALYTILFHEPNPNPTTPLPTGGELLIVGTHEQRQRFARMFG